MAELTPEQVRAFIGDSVENNHLLDDVEFTDARITLAMDMALDSYNNMPPMTSDTIATLRSKAILLYGTLYHLFNGQTALAARNQMSYSDGGLTIPIEERFQFYDQIARTYQGMFAQAAKEHKIARNMEAGWGHQSSDYITFPIW